VACVVCVQSSGTVSADQSTAQKKDVKQFFTTSLRAKQLPAVPSRTGSIALKSFSPKSKAASPATPLKQPSNYTFWAVQSTYMHVTQKVSSIKSWSGKVVLKWNSVNSTGHWLI